MTINNKIKSLLEANTNNTQPEGGLFLDKALQQAKLDFTPASLKRIDALINQVREKIKPAKIDFLNDTAKENFALTLASYICAYVGKETRCTATWLSYQEAVQALPPALNLQPDFTTHVMVVVEETALSPLAWVLRLFDAEAYNTEHCFNELLRLVKDRQAFAAGWSQEYLNDFLTDKPIAGGMALREALQEIKLDFSLESLDRIDELLLAIKKHTQPDYAEWMNAPAMCNFLYLMGTYLGATTALNANCFVKWINFEQTKAMYKSTPHTFGTSFNALFGGGTLMHPVGKVCDLLFADDNNINCRGFAERVIQDKNTPSMISIYPNMAKATRETDGFFAKLKSKPKFDVSWAEPFKEAGFLAAFAASFLASGSSFNPQLLQGAKPDRQKLIVDFTFYENWDKANAAASNYMEHNAEKVPFQVYIFDGYANLPLERLDAMYIDVRRYDSPNLSCLLIVPYRPATATQGFKIYSPKLCNSTINEELAADVSAAFFAGAKGFKGLDWDNKNWDKYFDERL